jgi:hypothetical protein
MNATLTPTRPPVTPAPSDPLARARKELRDAGWTAEVVTLGPDERAERLSDYALEG